MRLVGLPTAPTPQGKTGRMATGLGIPVFTTHTITGERSWRWRGRRTSAVRWNVAQRIVVAWVITMPAAGLTGALFFEFARLVL